MKVDFARADYGSEETQAVTRVLESDWLASGNENTQFEKEFAEYVGSKHAICVNSGSSANLLALACLQLEKGRHVLTSACGFPATLSPVLHLGLDPVLVDYDLQTHNVNVDQILEQISKVSAVIIAHTMGNPVEIDLIARVAKANGVLLIEDCCEAIGASLRGKKLGTFGTLGTYSFYPAHQITAGGAGGMIVTDDPVLARRCKSLRDWGKTWNWDEKLGDNKTMYDMKVGGDDYYRHYVYSELGYNMKLSEMNAAFGREQLKKLDKFVAMRADNHRKLAFEFIDLDDFMTVSCHLNAVPSWFGFIITIKDGSPIKRNKFGDYLESKGIRHRPFFAGNILKHEPFKKIRYQKPFPVADKLMRDSMFIGCHTKMSDKEIKYISEAIHAYCSDPELQR